jgi:hypothetical protein
LGLASQLTIVADAACGFNSYGGSLVKKERKWGPAVFQEIAIEELSQTSQDVLMSGSALFFVLPASPLALRLLTSDF